MRRILNKINRIIARLSEILEIGFKNRDVMKYSDCYVTIKRFLNYHKPVVLYDIGANSGRWSYVMHKLNPGVKSIIFFEPQNKYRHILENASFLPGVNKKIYEIALGNDNKADEIRGGTASASIFNTKEQDNFFPGSLDDNCEMITVRKLDDIFLADKLQTPDTVKIDVQGYELLVLQGGKKLFADVQYLIIELSFREFYDGQPKLSEIISFLEENNFTLIDFGYEWRGGKNNELLQVDAFFLNNKFKNNAK